MAKKTSKSDDLLAAQLAEVSTPAAAPKQHVTFAEAQAEAAGLPTTATATDEATPSKAPKAPKPPKLDAEGNPVIAAPRVKIAPGSPPSMVLASHITDKPTLYAATQLVKGDTANEAQYTKVGGVIDKLAKKVGEKAVNLLRHRSNPDVVQVYTRIGMDLMLKTGTMTSKSLTDEFLKKYTPGTARAQANQIMQLFPALSVAERADRGTLVVNEDSTIVADYKRARN